MLPNQVCTGDHARLGLVTPGLFLLAATARQRGNAVTVWRRRAALPPARARMSQNVPLEQNATARGKPTSTSLRKPASRLSKTPSGTAEW